jgi:hypothetical protein
MALWYLLLRLSGSCCFMLQHSPEVFPGWLVSFSALHAALATCLMYAQAAAQHKP